MNVFHPKITLDSPATARPINSTVSGHSRPAKSLAGTLAGYARHRTTFLRGGAAALRTELERDFGRLWQRNLGMSLACATCLAVL